MHEKIVCQEKDCNNIIYQCRCPSENKTVSKRGFCSEHKSSWYVWNWNKESKNKNYNQDNIVVSKSWIDVTSTIYGLKDDGKIVAGPFSVLTDAITKCDELNG